MFCTLEKNGILLRRIAVVSIKNTIKTKVMKFDVGCNATTMSSVAALHHRQFDFPLPASARILKKGDYSLLLNKKNIRCFYLVVRERSKTCKVNCSTVYICVNKSHVSLLSSELLVTNSQ